MWHVELACADVERTRKRGRRGHEHARRRTALLDLETGRSKEKGAMLHYLRREEPVLGWRHSAKLELGVLEMRVVELYPRAVCTWRWGWCEKSGGGSSGGVLECKHVSGMRPWWRVHQLQVERMCGQRVLGIVMTLSKEVNDVVKTAIGAPAAVLEDGLRMYKLFLAHAWLGG